jgi:hypothetical protein
MPCSAADVIGMMIDDDAKIMRDCLQILLHSRLITFKIIIKLTSNSF